jgi:hypothetical protein
MNTMTAERPPLTQIIGTVVFKSPAPAPNRSGKLKLEDGKILSAFPDKLVLVEVGGTYDFGCVVTEKQGVNYHDVKVVRPAPQAPQPSHRAQPELAQSRPQPQQQQRSAPMDQASTQQRKPPPDYNRQTHPVDSRRMFICSQLNAMIQSRQLVLDTVPIIEAIDMLIRAYDQTLGQEDAGQ